MNPQTKPLRFDLLTVGDEFKTGGPNAPLTYRKVAARKAILIGDPAAIAFAIRPTMVVTAIMHEGGTA